MSKIYYYRKDDYERDILLSTEYKLKTP